MTMVIVRFYESINNAQNQDAMLNTEAGYLG